jgi:hypothetical protein
MVIAPITVRFGSVVSRRNYTFRFTMCARLTSHLTYRAAWKLPPSLPKGHSPGAASEKYASAMHRSSIVCVPTIVFQVKYGDRTRPRMLILC